MHWDLFCLCACYWREVLSTRIPLKSAHTHRHTDNTHTHAHRQTDRLIDRQIDRQTDRQTHVLCALCV